MKKNQIRLFGGVLIILLGVFFLIYPELGVLNLKIVLAVSLGLIAIIKAIEYFLTREKKDYEFILYSLASLLASISFIVFYKEKSPLSLSLCLMGWIAIISIIKLIKIDYYMDRKNNMWYVRMVSFTLFILVGILTSINLYYTQMIQTLIIGYFFIVCGILEISDPAITLLKKENIKKDDK